MCSQRPKVHQISLVLCAENNAKSTSPKGVDLGRENKQLGWPPLPRLATVNSFWELSKTLNELKLFKFRQFQDQPDSLLCDGKHVDATYWELTSVLSVCVSLLAPNRPENIMNHSKRIIFCSQTALRRLHAAQQATSTCGFQQRTNLRDSCEYFINSRLVIRRLLSVDVSDCVWVVFCAFEFVPRQERAVHLAVVSVFSNSCCPLGPGKNAGFCTLSDDEERGMHDR